jgi:cholesterol oxidase
MTAAKHFDAVVVGSGFGGSVMAHRLQEAGLQVCLLERGKAYPPGSFPHSPHGLLTNVWAPDEGMYGLFDYWSFKTFDVLVASGLGGGSLIYANVLLRKDKRWFVQEDLADGGYEYWPVTRAELDPHYDRVEHMLRPQQYPVAFAPYRDTPKTKAFWAAAETVGLQPFLPNLAITFANDGEASGPRRAASGGAPEPARPDPPDLPALRRMRHRMQLRQQEHARLHLSLRGQAAGRRSAHRLRGHGNRTTSSRGIHHPLPGVPHRH